MRDHQSYGWALLHSQLTFCTLMRTAMGRELIFSGKQFKLCMDHVFISGAVLILNANELGTWGVVFPDGQQLVLTCH